VTSPFLNAIILQPQSPGKNHGLSISNQGQMAIRKFPTSVVHIASPLQGATSRRSLLVRFAALLLGRHSADRELKMKPAIAALNRLEVTSVSKTVMSFAGRFAASVPGGDYGQV